MALVNLCLRIFLREFKFCYAMTYNNINESNNVHRKYICVPQFTCEMAGMISQIMLCAHNYVNFKMGCGTRCQRNRVSCMSPIAVKLSYADI